MKKTCLLTLVIAGLGSASFGAATPNAKSMIWKSIHAHQTLGPCVIKATFVRQEATGVKTVLTGTVRWNDSTHYVEQLRTSKGSGSIYVNGSDQVFVNKPRKLWLRLDPNDPELQVVRERLRLLLPNAVTSELTTIVQNPDVARILTRVPLTTTKINGTPSYRLYGQTGTTPEGSAAFVAFAFGRSDALVRKAAVRDADGNTTRITANYARQARRFPASNFRFQRPADYTEGVGIDDFFGPDVH
ncbi:MAG TPA: hypothetical protein VGM51_09345 [Armatimonadota bacterium]|jgi:hypothetical protein